jgi:uncharacterized protein (DUF58 family)
MNTNAFRLLLFTVAMYLAAWTFDVRLLFYLAYVMTAVLIGSWIWARINLMALDVRREARQHQVQVGDIFEEVFTVRNRSFWPKLWLEVRDHSTLPGHQAAAVVGLRSGKAKRWRVRTVCRRRGRYALGPLTVASGDPFGLFRSWRTVPDMAELLVFPAMVDLSAFGVPPSDLPGGAQVQRRSQAMTPNASGLRDYVPGDAYNRIHWPATARRQILTVKEFELDPTVDVWVVLDLDRQVHMTMPRALADTDNAPPLRRAALLDVPKRDQPGLPVVSGGDDGPPVRLDPATEEYAVTAAASIAGYFLRQDRAVGLIASGSRPLVLTPDRGGRQLLKILRELAVVRADDPAPLAELLAAESAHFSRSDTIIVVTPSASDAWVGPLAHLKHRGVQTAAILIDPSSFGGATNSMLVIGALAALDVRSYLIKRNDALDLALHAPRFGPRPMR